MSCGAVVEATPWQICGQVDFHIQLSCDRSPGRCLGREGFDVFRLLNELHVSGAFPASREWRSMRLLRVYEPTFKALAWPCGPAYAFCLTLAISSHHLPAVGCDTGDDDMQLHMVRSRCIFSHGFRHQRVRDGRQSTSFAETDIVTDAMLFASHISPKVKACQRLSHVQTW